LCLQTAEHRTTLVCPCGVLQQLLHSPLINGSSRRGLIPTVQFGDTSGPSHRPINEQFCNAGLKGPFGHIQVTIINRPLRIGIQNFERNRLNLPPPGSPPFGWLLLPNASHSSVTSLVVPGKRRVFKAVWLGCH
jgi:hypothetical protein